MKNFKKILLWIFVVLIIALVSVGGYVKFALPDVGAAPELKVDATPQRIARGEYLANHVTICIDCHSKRDWTKFSGPPMEGTFGMGGNSFDKTQGFPGTFYAANITPHGISRYTDGELFRVITTGVTKEGKAIFPVMPYHYYGQIDPEDIKSIIAYIRTLEPIKNDVPVSDPDFPMNFIINTIPKKAAFSTMPPKTDIVNYGRYLTTAAACMECHTKEKKGNLVKGTEFGGGREFLLPDGSIVRSANISSDKETGIGNWSDEKIISLFRQRSDSATLNTTLKPGELNSIMPWTMYGKMDAEDLRAILAYLRTVKPVENTVKIFSPGQK